MRVCLYHRLRNQTVEEVIIYAPAPPHFVQIKIHARKFSYRTIGQMVRCFARVCNCVFAGLLSQSVSSKYVVEGSLSYTETYKRGKKKKSEKSTEQGRWKTKNGDNLQ